MFFCFVFGEGFRFSDLVSRDFLMLGLKDLRLGLKLVRALQEDTSMKALQGSMSYLKP